MSSTQDGRPTAPRDHSGTEQHDSQERPTVAEEVARLVALAPPLTGDQRVRLAALFG